MQARIVRTLQLNPRSFMLMSYLLYLSSQKE